MVLEPSRRDAAWRRRHLLRPSNHEGCRRGDLKDSSRSQEGRQDELSASSGSALLSRLGAAVCKTMTGITDGNSPYTRPATAIPDLARRPAVTRCSTTCLGALASGGEESWRAASAGHHRATARRRLPEIPTIARTRPALLRLGVVGRAVRAPARHPPNPIRRQSPRPELKKILLSDRDLKRLA